MPFSGGYSALLQVVGDVECQVPVGCLAPAEVADGEVGEVVHALECRGPRIDGVGIGYHHDVAPAQRFEHRPREHRLVARGNPRQLRERQGTRASRLSGWLPDDVCSRSP